MASKLLLRSKEIVLNTTSRQLATFSSSPNYLPFDTLHALNSNAVKKYESNPLFGTFRNDKFEWMTYGEFGRRVDRCRGLLWDLGELYLSLIV